MKTFTFLAKQGQHDNIARLLTERFGKPRLSIYRGPRGEGVLVSLPLSIPVSKRTVDRFLHSQNVPGSVERRNKIRIFNVEGIWDAWKVRDSIGYNVPFIRIVNKKMVKSKLVHVRMACTCCSGYDEIVDV